MITRIPPGNTTLTVKDLQAAYPVLYLNCDTSAPCNIYLPVIANNNTFFGVEIFIVDGNPFNAGTYPITIFTEQPNLINGQTQVAINTNNASARIRIVSPNDYLFLSSESGGSYYGSIITTDGSLVPTAMPLMITPAAGQVVNIISQLKGVSESGKIYSVVINRTIIGVQSDPLGAIEGIENAKQVSKQTRGTPLFAVDYTETDATGFIQVTHEPGEVITWTVKESYN